MPLSIDEADARMRGVLTIYTASFFVWGGALTALAAILPQLTFLEHIVPAGCRGHMGGEACGVCVVSSYVCGARSV